jgi:rhodanese-related sulfurtransferase/glyoxylase-like metal-dependent hydrolase (beta-lactamase superfamily II)
VVVDPDRSVARYLAAAAERDLSITSVLETHLHADFVTGSVELASWGGRVYAPERSELQFPHRPVRPGERLRLGELQIDVLASPGHTPEHVSYVFRNEELAPVLFSGGSLIAGGAARTDLIDPSMTETLTRAQYRTLTQAFAELPDETRLLPTHGGGSFCSVGSTGKSATTLGQERRGNRLLEFSSEDEFATWFPTTFPAAPAYFFRMRALNRSGPRLRSGISGPPPLGPTEFEGAIKQALVVDVRSVSDYAAGHVPGSLSNPLRSSFPVWLGWLVPPQVPLAFVTEDVRIGKVVEEALLVGYEIFAGWLAGGMSAWEHDRKPIARSKVVDPSEATRSLLRGAIALDVREPSEVAAGGIPGARHIPLGELAERADELPKTAPILAYCGQGERASSAISVLERAGFRDLSILPGGFGAWKESQSPATDAPS